MITEVGPTALEIANEKSWFKSSYSTDTGAASCVSIAPLTDRVGIRDTKQNNGPAVVIPAAAWTSFIREVQADRLTGT
ncbi:DUF397 domain-containing protein [Streptomyces triculaminicus]|uniref:DUF397 domain-containing protein n=1 Tax=Streptomyces triculaminicus TaxID=2816232 RepID=A0A939FL97_9ACTN|nr:DUF397 domain-containing protein [Streptomyces triculaminicus]MBO0651895.1 DUF397 domain-containing protein [Streptomyces triculaminicus]